MTFYLIFRHAKSGNGALVTSLSEWVFKEKGVLRVKSVAHHHKGQNKPPAYYTITDEVVRFIAHPFSDLTVLTK